MTKKKLITSVCLLLSLFMLLSVAVSCTSKKKTPATDESTKKGGEAVTSDPNSPYDANGYLKDSLDGINYNGKTVNVLTWDNNPYLFPLESSDTDKVVDLVYRRDRELEDRLGVEFEITRKTSSASADKSHANALYNTLLSGAEAFDVVAAYAIWPAYMAYQGMLYDLNSLDYPESDKPWYSGTEQWEVYNRLFYIASNSSVSSFNSMKIIYANTALIKAHQLDDVVDLVLDGGWTLDKMMEYSRNWASDAENNPDNHIYGILWCHRVLMEGFFYSAGFHGTEKDANGLPQLTYEDPGMVERIDNFVEKIRTIMNSPECHILQKADMSYVVNHKTVFYAATLEKVIDIAGDKDISIIPLPKLNEEQAEYHTSRDHGYDVFCVPTTTADPQVGAVIIEGIASSDYRTIGPDYFDRNMKYRYSNSEKGVHIFELIRNSITLDFATCNYKPLNGQILENVLRNCVYPWTNGGADGPVYDGQNFTSQLEGVIENHRQALEALQKVYANFK